MFVSRIFRFALAFIVVVALAAAGVIAALFYWINEASVKKAVEDLSAKTLGASVVFDGPVKVSRLTDMKVSLPAMTFIKKASAEGESDTVVGRVKHMDATVSLWSLALGAIQVQSVTVTGLEGTLNVPELSGNALFDHTFGAVSFPDDLRINAVTVKDAKLDLTVSTNGNDYSYRLSDLYAQLGHLSPEGSAPFELSARFAPLGSVDQGIAQSDKVNEAELSAQPAPVPADNNAVESKAQEESPSDGAEKPQAPISPEAGDTAPANEPEASTEAAENTAADLPANPTQEVTGDTSSEAASALPEISEQPANEASDQKSATPSSDAAEPTDAQTPEKATPTVSFADFLGITQARAQAADFLHSEVVFLSFDPKTSEGALSAQGRLTISSLDRYVVFQDLNLSVETFVNGTPFTMVAKADRIRFKDEEVFGNNVTAALSRPQESSGDIHLGAADFRLRPMMFESPELRLSYAKESSPRTVTLEVTSAVRADMAKRHTELDNFSARVTVTGDPTLPEDFKASLAGQVLVDPKTDIVDVRLSGAFANAPFSYNGTISDLASPKLQGELMIGEVKSSTIPAFRSLDWMHKVRFLGTLRVGQIAWKSHTGSQLHADLELADGTAKLSDLIVNTADGRVIGKAAFREDASWVFDGRLDGVNLEKVLAGFEAAPVVSGITSGTLQLKGTGSDAAALEGSAHLRLQQASYHGVDAQAARSYVAATGTREAVTRQNAATTFDEACVDVAIHWPEMKIENISARSVSLKSSAYALVNLENSSIEGHSTNLFAPMHGVPSVHLEADFAGPAVAPQWKFAWNDSRTALRRAQGKPAVEPVKTAPTDKKQKSLWQSVRDFFTF